MEATQPLEKEACLICFEEIAPKKNFLLSCKHEGLFHSRCLMAALVCNPSCPVCRSKFEPDQPNQGGPQELQPVQRSTAPFFITQPAWDLIQPTKVRYVALAISQIFAEIVGIKGVDNLAVALAVYIIFQDNREERISLLDPHIWIIFFVNFILLRFPLNISVCLTLFYYAFTLPKARTAVQPSAHGLTAS